MKTKCFKLIVGMVVAGIPAFAGIAAVAADEKREGFVDLFDGKDLSGWEYDANVWRVEQGEIVGGSLQEAHKKHYLVVYRKDFSDFELEYEMKLVSQDAKAIAWCAIRAQPGQNQTAGLIPAYEVQAGYRFWGSIHEHYFESLDQAKTGKKRGFLFAVFEKSGKRMQVAVKKGDWNRFHVKADGSRIEVSINGELLADFTDTAPVLKTGKIAFVLERGQISEIRLRHIRVRDLSGPRQGTVKNPVSSATNNTKKQAAEQ